MRGWGPAFAHFFGVSEEEVLATWTLERFRRYQAFARTMLKEV